MIIFSVPKPFIGEFDIIQNNAIESWLSIRPKPKIILFGDEEGVAAIAKKWNLVHIKNIKKNEHGTPLLNDIFAQAQAQGSRESIFMYVNTDIILLNFPTSSITPLTKQFKRFLAIGRRYEMDIRKRMTTQEMMRKINTVYLRQKSDSWMDYFIFTSGVFKTTPPFALGKTFWDKWLVWNALRNNAPVIDCTKIVCAIHQTHSYSMNKDINFNSVWAGEEAYKNLRLAGGWNNSATVADAQYVTTAHGAIAQNKRKRFSIRPLLDYVPILWPVLIRLRLLREKYLSIVHK